MVEGFAISEIEEHVRAAGKVVRIVIADHKGSTPREAGTSMYVTESGQFGTIGGGALEYDAVAKAKNLLNRSGDWQRSFLKVPLGPSLGQCCGGAVSLLLESFGEVELAHLKNLDGPFARPIHSGVLASEPLQVQKYRRDNRAGLGCGVSLQNDWLIERLVSPNQPVWVYGAGHVGRALVSVLSGLPFALTWVDSARDRFPQVIPSQVDRLVAANPADAVKHAPDEAVHLVLTYSHAIDLEICRRVLSRPFGQLGLIGSDTKRTRFLRRLSQAGLDASRLQCPIGDRSLGKEPMAIAVGVVSELLKPRAAEKRTIREVSA